MSGVCSSLLSALSLGISGTRRPSRTFAFAEMRLCCADICRRLRCVSDWAKPCHCQKLDLFVRNVVDNENGWKGTIQLSGEVEYRVVGMDCASCAAKIEKAVRSAGVENPKISVASQVMTLALEPTDARLVAVERAVSDAGYFLERIDTESDEYKPHLAKGYRRALWLVVILNAGFGIVEMVGGTLAGSQALKADALDFIGDGLITFSGVVAIGWGLAWRARSALIQGLFLGALGTGVVVNTAYRVFMGVPLDPGLMGSVAFVALAVNIAAALILVRHRAGDANVRAVWLFSRNDAIGNAAVVIAAGVAGWTGTRWPDLIVAFAMAGLFLHASWVIVRDSLNDLREAKRS